MLLRLDRHNGIPAYRQLIDQIRMGIASGLLRAGEELPSTRSLAAELDTNPMTVSKAYNQLEHDGLLLRRPGLSLVVADIETSGAEDPRDAEFRRAAEQLADLAKRLGLSPTRAKRLLGETMSELNEDDQ
jgi:GntR family transcriptional regulator